MVTNPENHSETFIKLAPNLAKALEDADFIPIQLIESYPRILEQIDATWGTADGMACLKGLLFSDREGRSGFPSEVADEILFIKDVLEVQHQELANSPFDPFSKHLEQSLVIAPPKRKSEMVDGKETTSATASADHGESQHAARATKARWDVIRSMDDLRKAAAAFLSGESLARCQGKLGEVLVAAGLVDDEQVHKALDIQKKLKKQKHTPIGEIFVELGLIDRNDVIRALCCQRGIMMVDAPSMEISPEAVRKVPIKNARARNVLPLILYEKNLIVAVSDPFDTEIINYLSFLAGAKIIIAFSQRESIDAALTAYADGEKAAKKRDFKEFSAKGFMGSEAQPADDEFGDGAIDSSNDEVDENDESIIGLVNKIINDAVRLGVSDIHFEGFPRARNAQIRLRKDGLMEHYSEYPATYHQAVVSRIKIMSDLDISERRRSQDGKISFGSVGGRRVDLRVAVVPTMSSIENVTLRILNSGEPLPLDKIGINAVAFKQFAVEIAKPYGLILVCGPTGSGKTTTLHSVLRELNTTERKIWTAEDPVEITQKNISQVQVNAKIGWSFASALRSFLRADPDVIMIGEMRDAETAKIGVEASMTGHLVLSTLHTNSAPETLARLLDLDVDPFNLADAVLAILAQRLARRVCRECGRLEALGTAEIEDLVSEYIYAGGSTSTPSKAERDRLLARWRLEFAQGGLKAIRPVGCAACNGTGYKGRLGIHELLVATPEIRRLVRVRASAEELTRQGVAGGMKTLRQDGIEKVVQGLTDIREIRSVCI